MAAPVFSAVYINYYEKNYAHECFRDERSAAIWVLQMILKNRGNGGIECDVHNTDYCERCAIDQFDDALKNPALGAEMMSDLGDMFDSYYNNGWTWDIKSSTRL